MGYFASTGAILANRCPGKKYGERGAAGADGDAAAPPKPVSGHVAGSTAADTFLEHTSRGSRWGARAKEALTRML